MNNSDYATELKPVVAAQNAILNNINTTLDKCESSLNRNETHSSEIVKLNKIIDELETHDDLLSHDLDNFDEELQASVAERSAKYNEHIKTLSFRNWNDFVRDSQVYCLTNKADYSLPWEAFLTEKDLEQLKNEDYLLQYKWDKWDYIFAGGAGVIAALTDYFWVRIPCKMPINSEFAGQKWSPITEWLRKYDTRKEADTFRNDWFANLAREFEERCKVPYDTIYADAMKVPGMYPKTHRFQSLGHDPVLGFIFGVLDIIRGTMTGFSYDKLTHRHTLFTGATWSYLNPVSLIEAILLQIGHLISDVATPSGLPAPFMTLFQGLNVGSFGKKDRTIGELARWMYENGYDFRHFLVSGITPGIIEIILRAYLMIRHYSEKGEVKFVLADNPKYRSMLLSAHAVACAGNAGKIYLHQGNPLAINYAEWLALSRYLLPSLKYWIFDKSKMQIEYYQNINIDAWNELTISSSALLEKVYTDSLEVISLGKTDF